MKPQVDMSAKGSYNLSIHLNYDTKWQVTIELI